MQYRSSRLLLGIASAIACGLMACSGGGTGSGSDDAAATEPAPEVLGGFSLPESAADLIERSILFHDPQGAWDSGRFRITQEASRPSGDSRSDWMEIARGGSEFQLRSERQGKPFALEVIDDAVSLEVAGKVPSEAEAAALNLDAAGALRMRNYYIYLYGLPMKLRDPGTLIDPLVNKVDYRGREALEVRVAYEEGVGSDVWYFDFDPDTAELIGYRFYHDEATNDGEYILLEGLAEIDGLRLPANRTWYRFEADELLGTDSIQQGDDSAG